MPSFKSADNQLYEVLTSNNAFVGVARLRQDGKFVYVLPSELDGVVVVAPLVIGSFVDSKSSAGRELKS